MFYSQHNRQKTNGYTVWQIVLGIEGSTIYIHVISGHPKHMFFFWLFGVSQIQTPTTTFIVRWYIYFIHVSGADEASTKTSKTYLFNLFGRTQNTHHNVSSFREDQHVHTFGLWCARKKQTYFALVCLTKQEPHICLFCFHTWFPARRGGGTHRKAKTNKNKQPVGNLGKAQNSLFLFVLAFLCVPPPLCAGKRANKRNVLGVVFV